MPAVLTLLRIKNLALVEELEWQMGPGFIAVTGETGAGKSIIIGALQLLLGERADKSLIRTGADLCTVEAVFSGNDLQKLNPQLVEAGVEPCENDLIIKRSFSVTGGTRQFINGSPTTLSILKNLGDELVDLHGPHDHQSLLSPETQLSLLDSFARADEQLEEYRKHYRQLQTFVAEHAALNTAETAREQELDLLRHQIAEIKSANLVAGEEEEIETRYKLASNSKRLIELGGADREQIVRGRRFRISRNWGKRSGCCVNWKRSTARSHNFHRPMLLLSSSFPRSRAPCPLTPRNSISIRSNSQRSSSAFLFLKL